jgi:hypothetical protein
MNKPTLTIVVAILAIGGLIQGCARPDPETAFDVADRLQIIDVLNSYSHNIDHGRVDDYLQLFTEGAIFETHFPGLAAMEFTGHNEIRTLAEGARARAATGIQRRHRFTNIIFDEQTRTSAQVRCYVLLTSTTNHMPQNLDLAGEYEGWLVKVGDQWKIDRWILRADNALALPAAADDQGPD